MGEYEETLEDIEKTYGMIPEFMKVFPREVIVKEWPDARRITGRRKYVRYEKS